MKLKTSVAHLAQLESAAVCARTASMRPFPEQRGARICAASDPDAARLTQRLISGLGTIETLVGKQISVRTHPGPGMSTCFYTSHWPSQVRRGIR
jgi:hypothetical protein